MGPQKSFWAPENLTPGAQGPREFLPNESPVRYGFILAGDIKLVIKYGFILSCDIKLVIRYGFILAGDIKLVIKNGFILSGDIRLEVTSTQHM